MKTKHILSILITLGTAVHMQAQMPLWQGEGVPTVHITRVPCLEYENDADSENENRNINRVSATQNAAPLKALGSPMILVCLANYSDVPFSVAKDTESLKALYNTFFNGKNQGVGDNPYSVYDYFNAMSNGLFTPEFIITDPITVPKKRHAYGSQSGSDARRIYRNDALTQLAPQIKERISEYDTNGDNKIDGVIIVFPGCGAQVGDPDGIHPCCWPSSISVSGVTYATSLVVPELLGMDLSEEGGDNNAKLNGIGVYVHEMSHMLGLPDFYDINYKGSGMDYWSLMDYGEYWNNGYTPTPYTAYERNFMGWMPLTELSDATTIHDMKTIEQGGSAYVIYNEANRNEYYILENRTDADPWSRNLCSTLGNGLMIYHVDYDASAWSNNRVNTNVNRQRMTIIPANGHFEIADNLMDDAAKYISELRGHLWPLKNIESVLSYWGIAGNNALTDKEQTQGSRVAPAARLHTPNTDGSYFMHKPITDIAYDADKKTISFNFMGGSSTGIEDGMNPEDSFGDHDLRVFAMDGRMIATLTENNLYTLPSGIYIVKDLVTGKTTKRIVGRQ